MFLLSQSVVGSKGRIRYKLSKELEGNIWC